MFKMFKMISCKRIQSVLVGALLTVGLLVPIPAGHAQEPVDPAQSRSRHFKMQNIWERLQGTDQKANATNLRAARVPQGPRVRVLQRERLGTYIEDIDFVPNGPFANQIIMLVGYAVYGIPSKARSHDPIRMLFDLRRQILGAPTGITYIASERLFAVVDAAQPTNLLVFDSRGDPLPPRPIHYLGDLLPDHIEGLAYLPPSSPLFPDHLLTVTWKFTDDFPFVHIGIQVLRRDGLVAAEIPIPDDISINGVNGIASLAPDKLLISDEFDQIWELDFAGNILSGPVPTGLLAEGIVQLPDGRIVTGEGAQLRFFDAALNRLPRDDRDAGTRIGIVNAFSVAWNSDTFQHLVIGTTEESGGSIDSSRVVALPLSLDASRLVLDLGDLTTAVRIPKATYMQDEHLIAVALRQRSPAPAQIALYRNDGRLVELVDASAIAGIGRPTDIAYIRPTRQFAVLEQTQPSKLKILTRTGALEREIDFASAGIGDIAALAYFNPLHPSGGQFLIFGTLGRAVITDFNGTPTSEFDYRDELGLTFVTGASAITIGPLTAAFSALESGESQELVVFVLN